VTPAESRKRQGGRQREIRAKEEMVVETGLAWLEAMRARGPLTGPTCTAETFQAAEDAHEAHVEAIEGLAALRAGRGGVRKVSHLSTGACRACSECEGNHHFSDAMLNDAGDHECKHCSQTARSCPKCDGDGQVEDEKCARCDGRGVLLNTRPIAHA
jgi:hypothetical protein